MVNAVATGGIAALAGGDLPEVVRLGLSMLLLQASIGAVNDVVDAPLDALLKPSKPVAAGLVPVGIARAWAAVAGAIGLLLAVGFGPAALAVAGAGVSLGYVYDLWLSRSVLSWLPLALALPLVPVFAWVGATGAVPPGLAALSVAAALAGTGLMIGNGLVDLEGDSAAGKRTIAVRLGRQGGWVAHAAALACAVAVMLIVAPTSPGGGAGAGAGGRAGSDVRSDLGVVIGAGVIALGAGLVSARTVRLRERGWEFEAIGTTIAGLAWLAWLAGGAL